MRATHPCDEPVLVSAAYTRPADDQATASLAIKAEIGPVGSLVASTAVLSEMLAWCDSYHRLINIYLKGDVMYSTNGYKLTPEHTSMPLCNPYERQRDYLQPASIEFDDPRPVLTHEDGTLKAIDRRRVYHVVNFDVDPATDDRVILRSAFGNLAEHLSTEIHEWYNKSKIRLRPHPNWPSTREFHDRVQEEKKRLGL